MEKIDREELMKRLELSEEELKKVSGGIDELCEKEADERRTACVNNAYAKARTEYEPYSIDYEMHLSAYLNTCAFEYGADYMACLQIP